MKVADINVCTDSLKRILSEDQAKIDFKELFEKSKGIFPQSTLDQAKKTFWDFKAKAKGLGVEEGNYAGVATSVFRDAKNASQFFQSIYSDLGIKIQVIAQKDEAILGLYSAMTKVPNKQLIVWDIGGGSMQITSLRDGKILFFGGKLAAISFRDRVLKEIKKAKSGSPNPLSAVEIEVAVRIAEKDGLMSVPAEVKEEIKIANGVVYGVGSVHGFSIKDQIHKTEYGPEDVLSVLEQQADKTDEQIGGKYASTDVSNLALVLGYMRALNIKKVRVLDANNAEGILISRTLWATR